ncbi:hypothetical protein ABT173_29210 [Streptomyces sp. NPDC001795]|uniref:hypothetical protein n=1 Tax=unclassified Streptomyces TaxID=2593676 RepID=UPI003325F2D0
MGAGGVGGSARYDLLLYLAPGPGVACGARGACAAPVAGHPDSAEALRLAALLVAHPAAVWYDEQVRRQARALLDAATAAPGHEHRDALRELRTALINAGDIDAARS